MTDRGGDAAEPADRLRVVAIGGGHGLARALGALRLLGIGPTAVVTVADNGGSSGRLRRDLGIIAPGDLRMALLTLARNAALADVLAHRFDRGQLKGHALGNLLLVALAEQSGGAFVPALRQAAGLLDCDGEVLPSTTAPVELQARVAGRTVDGQVEVATARGRVEAVWLVPDRPPACPEALAAIAAADLVVLGPGSLFTSVIANLLVPDLADSIRRSPARLVYVANLRTQPGETSGLELGAHVEALLAHLGGRALDAVLVHDGPVGEGPGEPLGTRLDSPHVHQVQHADLAGRTPTGELTAAHDDRRLSQALAPLLRPAAPAGERG